MVERDFVNLTPYTTHVLDGSGETLSKVSPSGVVALAGGDPPQLINVPDPQEGTVYIVLPAVTEVSDRDDLISVEIEEANRSHRGNVRSHICHWHGEPSETTG